MTKDEKQSTKWRFCQERGLRSDSTKTIDFDEKDKFYEVEEIATEKQEGVFY